MQISETYSQIQGLINSSQKVLLVTRKGPTLDGLCSLLAISSFFKSRGQDATLLAEGLNPKHYSYLPNVDRIKPKLPPQNLVITLDLTNSPVEKIDYETKGGKLELTIVPQKGFIDPKGVNFLQTGLGFDLMIAVDTPNIVSLGEIASLYQETLTNLAIINIDVASSNNLYGKINWVDDSKVSVTQLLLDFFARLDLDISPSIALYILTGIYFRTFGLQKNVTPSVLHQVANLIEKGADYNLVAQNAAIKSTKLATTKPMLDNETAQAYIR